MKPIEVRETMRTSEFTGSAAVRSKVGSRSLMSKACPRWFVPNCSSYPSFVKAGPTAMMPALHTRISRRWDSEMNRVAASFTEARDARSHSTKVILTSGTAALMSLITAVALLEFRPLK